MPGMEAVVESLSVEVRIWCVVFVLEFLQGVKIQFFVLA